MRPGWGSKDTTFSNEFKKEWLDVTKTEFEKDCPFRCKLVILISYLSSDEPVIFPNIFYIPLNLVNKNQVI